MKFFKSMQDLQLQQCQLAIGNFDGLHLGHREVFSHLDGPNLPKVVLAFNPHPQEFFGKEMSWVIPREQRRKTLGEMGIDYFVEAPFDEGLARTSAADFCENLERNWGLRKLVVGENFAFGKGRQGNQSWLRQRAAEKFWELVAVPTMQIAGNTCSSSSLREILNLGDVGRARILLGHEFHLLGLVQKGKQLGRKIGFPTLNLSFAEKLALRMGVYRVRVQIDLDVYPGIANFGVRPTITASSSQQVLEVHVFDFHQEIYGREIKVHFIDFIRDEKKFNSLEDLQKQIHLDVNAARESFFGKKNL